jgi:hypothetical protein
VTEVVVLPATVDQLTAKLRERTDEVGWWAPAA